MSISIFKLFSEYLSKSTIHGLSYFGDHKRHWVERIFWIVTFIISMAGCFFMVHKTYSKWQQSPLIVTQDDKFTPLSEIPFPAVTVCPSIKLSNTETNLTRTYEILHDYIFGDLSFSDDDWNITNYDIKLLMAASLLCPETLSYASPLEFLHSYEQYRFDVGNFLEMHRPPYNRTLDHKFVGRYDWSLPWVLTDVGFCYTFNSQGNFQVFKEESIARNFRPYEADDYGIDWNAEDGYQPNATTPLRAYKSQPKDGLQLILYQESESGETNCPYDTSRTKVIIHPPGEFPRVSENFISIPLNYEVTVAVKPVMMTTAPDLARYSTEIRQCYFNNERSLKFFKFYTRLNCELECLTNFTLAICGCVKISMPRDENTLACLPEKVACMYSSEYYFRMYRIGLDDRYEDMQQEFNFSHEQMKSIRQPCGCLPSCVSLDYEFSVSQSEMAVDKAEYYELKTSRANIFFKEETFLKLKRSELYGWSDFIANCGGLLGLFMGVSILSLVEILYFATLRFFCSFQPKVSDEVTAIKTKVAE